MTRVPDSGGPRLEARTGVRTVWRMEMEKKFWIPTGTGNTVVLCVLWRLRVEDQGGVA